MKDCWLNDSPNNEPVALSEKYQRDIDQNQNQISRSNL